MAATTNRARLRVPLLPLNNERRPKVPDHPKPPRMPQRPTILHPHTLRIRFKLFTMRIQRVSELQHFKALARIQGAIAGRFRTQCAGFASPLRKLQSKTRHNRHKKDKNLRQSRGNVCQHEVILSEVLLGPADRELTEPTALVPM